MTIFQAFFILPSFGALAAFSLIQKEIKDWRYNPELSHYGLFPFESTFRCEQSNFRRLFQSSKKDFTYFQLISEYLPRKFFGSQNSPNLS